MKYFFLVLWVCFLGMIAIASAEDSVPVAGCNRLVLVLDERLTASVLEREWASGNARNENPARLELRGCGGQLLDSLKFDAALARLNHTPLRGTAVPTYLLTLDLTAESGSYNGPLTLLIEVGQHRLQQATASNTNQQSEPVQLALTGKAAWQQVTRHNVDQFLSVSCQPQKNGFMVSYRRYSPSRHGWQVRTRTQPGFWESDSDFPDDRLFP